MVCKTSLERDLHWGRVLKGSDTNF
jgi:hypothetical protein